MFAYGLFDRDTRIRQHEQESLLLYAAAYHGHLGSPWLKQTLLGLCASRTFFGSHDYLSMGNVRPCEF